MFVYPNIDPVALDLGQWDLQLFKIHPQIHWYALMYLFGFAAFYGLGLLRTKKPNGALTSEQLADFIFYGVLGVVLGARIGYALFYNFDVTSNDPMSLFKIWQGGMSFHGGFIGVMLATLYFVYKYPSIGFFRMTDFIAPLAPLGLMFGRIGNFINGELWGKPTDESFPLAFLHNGEIKHPSMLYEAFGEGLLLFLVLWWFSSKPRPVKAVSGLFLIGYGLARFTVEFVRLPDAHIGYLAGGWLTMGQVLTFPMMLAGATLMVWAYVASDKDAVTLKAK